MSLLKKIKHLKNNYRSIEKITSSTISTEITKEANEENIANVSGIYLNINSSFKMLTIEYIGEINILDSYKGLSLSFNSKRIVILNYGRVNLKNNLLLEYEGIILEFKKVVVYGWGQKHFAVSKTTPGITSFDVNRNENIVSTSDIKFYSRGEE